MIARNAVLLVPCMAMTLHAGEIVLEAPAPARAAQRLASFESRLSDDSPYLRQVADRFFNYLQPNITAETVYGDDALAATFRRAQALHAQGRYREALETYRDGFMDRLAAPAGPLLQEARQFMPKAGREEVLAQAEHLMRDPLVMVNPVVPEALPAGVEWRDFVEQNRARVQSLRLVLGTPGLINWTWMPENMTPVNAWNPERWVEDRLGDVLLAAPLLRAYEETGEPRYLRRYADILDDRHMNWLDDVLASGRGLEIGVNSSEGYAGEIGLEASLFGVLRQLAVARPESRREFPALTLAESLLRMAELYIPVQMRLVRCITGNRLSHMYSHRLAVLGLSFPEFTFSGYMVREKRRAFEVYPVASGYPDGHDVNWAYNYAFNYPQQRTLDMLRRDPGHARCLTDAYGQYHRDQMIRRMRTLAHSLFINGTAPRWAKPDKDYGVRWRKLGNRQPDPAFPDWLVQHDDILRIAATVYGSGWAGEPLASSDAFPYTGFYHLRTGWRPQEDIDVFFSPYRPFHYWGPSMWGHLKLFAFGRTFIDHRSGGELLIDGAPKVESETAHLLPAHYLTDWRVPAYGLPQWHMGDDAILPYRFFTSAAFDYAEGVYAAPFIARESRVVIEDVRQERRVMLARNAGLLIVADRIQSATNRLCTLQWGLHASVSPQDVHYDADRGAVHTGTGGAANLSLYQVATSDGVYAGAQAGGEALERLAEINWRGRFGQDIKTENLVFHYGPSGDLHVITILHVRRPGEEPLASFTPVRDASGIGFEAMTTSGERVAFLWRTGSGPMTLQAGSARLVLDDAHEPDHAELPGEDGRMLQVPVVRPLPLVRFESAATVFEDSATVALSHATPGTVIHYTLDGTDPVRTSPRYREPLLLADTTLVKAVAVRGDYAGEIGQQSDSTAYSLVASAYFTRRAAMDGCPPPVVLRAGLRYAYYEGDVRLSGLTFPQAGRLVREGIVERLVEVPVRPADTATSFGLRYSGYLKIPVDGVYTVWAPDEFMHWAVDTGCDLQVRLNGERWEPATQRHGFRGWSVPLKAGLHRLEVDFVDMRPGDRRPGETTGRVYWFDREQARIGDRLMWEHRIWDGESPELELSGPGLPRQPVPPSWLMHAEEPDGVEK